MYYFNYSWQLIVICDRLWVLLDSQQPEDYNSQTFYQLREEQLFWFLISFVYFPMKNYYKFSNNKDEDNMRGSIKRNKYNLEMRQPLCNNKIGGIKADLLLLKVLIKENMPELNFRINQIGLPLEYYFAEHILSCFCQLFSFKCLYRLWDIILYESSLEVDGLVNILMLNTIYTLLIICQNDLRKAKNHFEFESILKLNAQFLIQPDLFFEIFQDQKKKINEKLYYYLNILLNIEEELSEFYQKTCIQNLAIKNFVNSKNENSEFISIASLVKITKNLSS